eukprot:scaffold1579_cov215-Prasinococcus_capsulatus_cf.AAC.2
MASRAGGEGGSRCVRDEGRRCTCLREHRLPGGADSAPLWSGRGSWGARAAQRGTPRELHGAPKWVCGGVGLAPGHACGRGRLAVRACQLDRRCRSTSSPPKLTTSAAAQLASVPRSLLRTAGLGGACVCFYRGALQVQRGGVSLPDSPPSQPGWVTARASPWAGDRLRPSRYVHIVSGALSRVFAAARIEGRMGAQQAVPVLVPPLAC